MERYHILKLGLAITFYAAYCARPMLVYSLDADNELDQNSNVPNPDHEFFRYINGVEGRPGVDFPVYSYIPRTAFSCRGIESGYYADLDTDCQVFHICEDGKKISFLCPNGTIFQQSELICEWWNKVNCSNSPSLYEESAERLINDNARRKAARKVAHNGSGSNHGAIMRMEERSSVSAIKNGRNYPVRQDQQSRLKNHRIPDNNDIEQQLEQESNNRYLANAQGILQTSERSKSFHHQNHNYNVKQVKKDIDKSTGNYVNNNYEQTEKNKYEFKTNRGKSTTLKEYHVQFGSTSAGFEGATETYTPTQINSLTRNSNNKSYTSFGSKSTTTNSKISSTTVRTTTSQTTTDKFAYGTDIKGKFNSFDARPPKNIETMKSSSRSSIRYSANSNYVIDQQKSITTYSPPVRSNSQDGTTFELPPFPKHKSEQAPNNNDGQIVVNVFPQQSTESQVPQESSSFVKNPFNSIADDFKTSSSPYPNHRSTYSDLKDLSYLEAPRISSISSITPHLVTTQPINSGKPFVGSRIGNEPTTQSKYTYLPTTSTPTIIFGVLRHNHTTEPSPFGPPIDKFNVGNTDKTLPPVEISTPVTNAVPTGKFNVGNTDSTISPNVFSTTLPPLKIYVPEQGSLNLGLEPVHEPPFIKKNIPLLFDGTSTTQEPTPYSPTVPTVTQLRTFNQAVPIKFGKDQERISVHLSKNIGGRRNNGKSLKVGAVVHVRDDDGGTEAPNGFFVTKETQQRPRPFAKSLEFGARLNKENAHDKDPSTFPAYHISSARPFGISDTTNPTPTFTTETPPTFDVYDNVDNMIGVLQEIAKFNAPKDSNQESRPGLVIPPSVSPQTLHSLAQYFAHELQKNDTDDEALEPETKEKLSSLLTAMTVHGYNNLFNAGSTSAPTEATPTTVRAKTTTIIAPTSRFSGEDDGKSGDVNKNTAPADSDDLTTTSLPELRQLARNFSLALSSYLNDPDTFRKNLEGLRPTEPPPLDGTENVDANINEDELLNFSDADIKPSTPPNPSPTWGYILAAEASKAGQEDVRNSLNPDLNTADSQSFVPRFNNVHVKEKAFTDLPPGHWTSSPEATKLWQKALSVNPAIVNDRFETTPSSIFSAEEETTEPELFNQDVLPTNLELPQSEIRYDLRALPPLTLNSTQVHGILIDFMNHTKSDEHNRLNRILKKLNTSEEEFLDRMKEIESNPLTKRLILLLISECGANVTQDLPPTIDNNNDSLIASASTPSSLVAENQSLKRLVHPLLSEEDQDTRALQLLNSLYTIASRFGKRR